MNLYISKHKNILTNKIILTLSKAIVDYSVKHVILKILLDLIHLERIIMSEFTNATVVKKANIYFDGKVSSRTVILEDGTRKTLGFMLPGEYEFDTVAAENMEFLQGKLEVKLPGSEEWISIVAPQSFDVPANSIFHLKVSEPSDYCCHYL